MPKREYVITEHFVTSQDIYVRAGSKAEALEKVKDGEGYTEKGDVYPKRAMSIHDVRVSKADMTCEVCGGAAWHGYLYGQARVAGLCGVCPESGDPSPSGPASQLERGINAPSRDHVNGRSE